MAPKREREEEMEPVVDRGGAGIEYPTEGAMANLMEAMAEIEKMKQQLAEKDVIIGEIGMMKKQLDDKDAIITSKDQYYEQQIQELVKRHQVVEEKAATEKENFKTVSSLGWKKYRDEQAKNEELQKQLDQARANNPNPTEQVTTYNDPTPDLFKSDNAQVNYLRNQLSVARRRAENLSKQAKQAPTSYASCANPEQPHILLQEHEACKAKAKEQFEKLQAQIASHKAQCGLRLRSLTNDVTKLEDECAGLKDANEKFDEEYEDLQAEAQTKIDGLEETIREITESADLEQRNFDDRLALHNSQASANLAESQQDCASFREQVTALANQSTTLHQQVTSLQNELRSTHETYQFQLNQERTASTDNNESAVLRENIKALEDDLRSATDDHQFELKKEQDAHFDTGNQLLWAGTDIDLLTQQNEDFSASLRQLEQDSEAQATDLRKQIEDRDGELQQREKVLRDCEEAFRSHVCALPVLAEDLVVEPVTLSTSPVVTVSQEPIKPITIADRAVVTTDPVLEAEVTRLKKRVNKQNSGLKKVKEQNTSLKKQLEDQTALYQQVVEEARGHVCAPPIRRRRRARLSTSPIISITTVPVVDRVVVTTDPVLKAEVTRLKKRVNKQNSGLKKVKEQNISLGKQVEDQTALYQQVLEEARGHVCAPPVRRRRRARLSTSPIITITTDPLVDLTIAFSEQLNRTYNETEEEDIVEVTRLFASSFSSPSSTPSTPPSSPQTTPSTPPSSPPPSSPPSSPPTPARFIYNARDDAADIDDWWFDPYQFDKLWQPGTFEYRRIRPYCDNCRTRRCLEFVDGEWQQPYGAFHLRLACAAHGAWRNWHADCADCIETDAPTPPAGHEESLPAEVKEELRCRDFLCKGWVHDYHLLEARFVLDECSRKELEKQAASREHDRKLEEYRARFGRFWPSWKGELPPLYLSPGRAKYGRGVQ